MPVARLFWHHQSKNSNIELLSQSSPETLVSALLKKTDFPAPRMSVVFWLIVVIDIPGIPSTHKQFPSLLSFQFMYVLSFSIHSQVPSVRNWTFALNSDLGLNASSQFNAFSERL